MAASLFHTGELERSRQRPREACAAFARAFELYRGPTDAERSLFYEPESLARAAREAAGCGVDSARLWLAAGRPPS